MRKKYDYNIIVIGGGSAGLVAAYIATTLKAKVALVENNKMGGDCLNTGCVPSKALIRSAKILAYAKQAQTFGLKKMEVTFDFKDVMQRVHNVIKTVEPHDSYERYTALGVDCLKGYATIISPHHVKIHNKTLTARSIIIATGANPLIPPIPGLDKIDYLTSDNIWHLKKLPKKLAILGGGPIGSEMAQAFARLGSSVTLIEMAPQLLCREDEDVIECITKKFSQENIRILTNHQAKLFKENTLICDHQGQSVTIHFDKVMVCLGRKANIQGLGLETLGIKIRNNGSIDTNPFLQTNIPSIYVCGDVTGPYQFTHMAGYQAGYSCINALFSPFKKFKVDYRIVPWTTFTDPEIARLGLNEKTAKAQNIPYEVTKYEMKDLDRAIADNQTQGFVKILTPPNKDKILGVTLVSAHAGELIAEYILAMKYGIGLNKILNTIHTYPTLAEANRYAAGEWRKAHVSPLIMRLLKRFHHWRL